MRNYKISQTSEPGAGNGGAKGTKEFIARFEGRVTQISKDGHLGVVAKTEKPIQKVQGKNSGSRLHKYGEPTDLDQLKLEKMNIKLKL